MRGFPMGPVLLFLALTASSISATAASDNEIGLGLYEKPEYIGADEQEWVVLPSFKLHASHFVLTLRGERLLLDFLTSPNINAGLMVRYDEGRGNDLDDEVVRLLPTVTATAELGLFVESGFPVRWLGWDDPTLVIGSANLRDAVGEGHEGQVLEVAVGLFREFGESTSLTLQYIATRTDTDYNRAYFGVSEADAAATGLASFNPNAGLKDTQTRLVLDHEVSPEWTVGLTTSYGRLSDTLSESPVVSSRGDRTQWTTGIFVNRRL